MFVICETVGAPIGSFGRHGNVRPSAASLSVRLVDVTEPDRRRGRFLIRGGFVFVTSTNRSD